MKFCYSVSEDIVSHSQTHSRPELSRGERMSPVTTMTTSTPRWQRRAPTPSALQPRNKCCDKVARLRAKIFRDHLRLRFDLANQTSPRPWQGSSTDPGKAKHPDRSSPGLAKAKLCSPHNLRDEDISQDIEDAFQL